MIQTGTGYNGGQQIAPVVESEDQFDMADFEYHFREHYTWATQCHYNEGIPVLGSVIKAVVKICDGDCCIGRSPRVVEWIKLDLPKYAGNVITDMWHVPP